ncbi:DNA repair protein RadA [Rhodobium gokarnense]|uniref:DNA repair protein RadA n=1 Tax=Rhodobium gokarnense TaxID=364296 RepID=A0ABT3HFM8_9HYPH|nr:DNA repair protein RadA [Rhodobium gokarnense]MCW2309149.1 DNA repair protein RadA/Sms [Rhodobium gokarnense]
MARRSLSYVCQNCGNVTARWAGRCEACGEWNTIVEESESGGIGAGPKKGASGRGRVVPLVPLAGTEAEAPRITAGIAELDRVTGGGFVRGSALLIGGDPGIGKSTLLLQACAALASAGSPVIYISGEEAIAQVRLRAERLGLAGAPVQLAAETNIEDILATLKDAPTPALVIVDSIQTLWTDTVESAPGTVTQVRASAQALVRYAKNSGAAVVLVGHVTKDGQIAGPRVVEHLVDAVLYFEGDGAHQFRILRSVKNRFGPTDEIGVFEMTSSGLNEVPNPSELFLGDRHGETPGAAVFAGMEGTRPLLVEIQALVAPSPLGNPRRTVVGWDSGRLSMILAVLEARCGLRIGTHDVYLAVAGGLRINEPAADLAVAAALISSASGVALASETVYFGEVALSGAVRPVAHATARLKEARKLGFARAVAAAATKPDADTASGAALTGVDDLADLVARVVTAGDRADGPPVRDGARNALPAGQDLDD